MQQGKSDYQLELYLLNGPIAQFQALGSDLILAGLLFYVSGALAQTSYYNMTKTFYENGYTYQCDVRSGEGSVTLYNKNSQYTYTNSTYKDGSPVSRGFWEGFPELLKDAGWTKAYCNYIVNSAFSGLTGKTQCSGINVSKSKQEKINIRNTSK